MGGDAVPSGLPRYLGRRLCSCRRGRARARQAAAAARRRRACALVSRHPRRCGRGGAAVPRALSPRRFWQNVVSGPIAEAALAGRSREAEAQLVTAIEASSAGGKNETRNETKPETVFLVGAGPGDPDLLTLRALHVLSDADVVFYDELVTSGVLDRARRDAEQVFV